MTKVPVNFRIDSELLALAKARSEQDGITLIALLEQSLRASLEVSASTTPTDPISVEALVKTVVENVLDEIERVKVKIADIETSVNTNTESVNTIKAEVTGLSDKLNIVSATVNTVVKSNVNTNDPIDSSVTPAISNSQNWVNLTTVASQLEILPKSISGAASKRGRDIGQDIIEFDVAGKTIHKKGSGIGATYHIVIS